MPLLRMTGSLLGTVCITLMLCFMAPLMSKKSEGLRQEAIQPVQLAPLISPLDKPRQKKIIPKKMFKMPESPPRSNKRKMMKPADIRLNQLEIEKVPVMAATLPASLPAAPKPVKPALPESDHLLTDIFQVESTDIPPRLKRYTPPLYPPRAKGRGIEGKVIVRCVVSAGGYVREAKVVQAEPAGYFERSALNSIKKWTFVPATLKGEKVAVYVDIPLSFSLDR